GAATRGAARRRSPSARARNRPRWAAPRSRPRSEPSRDEAGAAVPMAPPGEVPMIRLDLAKLAIIPDDGVLKADDYRAYIDAQATLAAARADAERIGAEAEAEFRRQSERGFVEGLRKGQGDCAEQMLEIVSRGVEFLRGLEETVASLVMLTLEQMLGAMDD